MASTLTPRRALLLRPLLLLLLRGKKKAQGQHVLYHFCCCVSSLRVMRILRQVWDQRKKKRSDRSVYCICMGSRRDVMCVTFYTRWRGIWEEGNDIMGRLSLHGLKGWMDGWIGPDRCNRPGVGLIGHVTMRWKTDRPGTAVIWGWYGIERKLRSTKSSPWTPIHQW